MTAEANHVLKKIFCSLQKLPLILFLFPGLQMYMEPQMPSFIDTILEERVWEGLRGFYETQSRRHAPLSCSVGHEGYVTLWAALQ